MKVRARQISCAARESVLGPIRLSIRHKATYSLAIRIRNKNERIIDIYYRIILIIKFYHVKVSQVNEVFKEIFGVFELVRVKISVLS